MYRPRPDRQFYRAAQLPELRWGWSPLRWPLVPPAESHLLLCQGPECLSEAVWNNRPLGEAVEALVRSGWSTDGQRLHCPACPVLEVPGIVQAAAIVRREPVVQLDTGATDWPR
jgi:hypothetical protein